MGEVKGSKVIQSAQNLNNSLPFHFTSIRPTISEIQLFRNLTLKNLVKVMSEVKGQNHIVYLVFNRCTSFLFHINQTNHSWDMAKTLLDHEKTHRSKFFNANSAPKKVSNRISPKSNQIIMVTRGIKLQGFCSGWISGSHFIVQTSKFLLINATAMTMGQGHGKVIQYISPDLYILCPRYVRFGTNGFDARGKSLCGRGGGGNELIT